MMGRLLALPDELLDQVTEEVQFAHATADGRDLLAYQRRDTNRSRQAIERLSYTCKRLRAIAIPHLKRHPRCSTGPLDPNIRALRLRDREALRLAESPLANLEDLALSRKERQHGLRGDSVIDDDGFIDLLRRCQAIQTLVVSNFNLYEEGVNDFLQVAAALPKLQHLTIRGLLAFDYIDAWDLGSDLASDSEDESAYDGGDGGVWERLVSFNTAVYIRWAAPLTRLEIWTTDAPTPQWFICLMEKFAATLQVAILKVNANPGALSPSTFRLEHVDFPALWRLSMLTSYPSYPPSLPNVHDTRNALLAVWMRAPELACLKCSLPLTISTPAQLQQIADLRSKPQLKYARLTLKTWEGPKGSGWKNREIQKIRIGR